MVDWAFYERSESSTGTALEDAAIEEEAAEASARAAAEREDRDPRSASPPNMDDFFSEWRLG